MGRSWGIAPLLGAALAAVALLAAPAGTAAEVAAAPKTDCGVEFGTLKIDSNGADFTIARQGNRIVVARGSQPVACSGPAASVDTIDRVYGTGGDIITLDLRDGALEPGATPEADGSDEIEIRLAVTTPVILLDDRARHVALGEGDDDAIIDLDLERTVNAAEADVRVPIPTPFQASIELRAGSGDDVISAGGAFFDLALRQHLLAFGGAGDDRLTGPDWDGGLLAGGAGRDRLAGGRGEDFLLGGGGGDRVRAGRGPDWVLPGGGADRADCGRGRDIFTKDSAGDRMRNCENLVRGQGSARLLGGNSWLSE